MGWNILKQWMGQGESKQLKNALFYYLFLASNTEALTMG